MPQLDFWPTKGAFGSRVQIGAEHTPNPNLLRLHEKQKSFGEGIKGSDSPFLRQSKREREEATDTMAATDH